jgi:hypothetical protein
MSSGASGRDGPLEPAGSVIDMKMQIEAIMWDGGITVLRHGSISHRSAVDVDPGIHDSPVIHLDPLADLLGAKRLLVEVDGALAPSSIKQGTTPPSAVAPVLSSL